MVLDLFIDPVAVRAGYWIWLVKGAFYFGIPLLNYVGWFVLISLASLSFILIARYRHWGYWQKAGAAFGALLPLVIDSTVVSLILNGIIAALGIQ